MKNLLQTHSISWAQSVKLTLESEGIEAVILDENAPGYMGFAGRIRVAVVKDSDLARAQTVLSRLTPPLGAPPPSWRVQKRGLQLLALGLVLMFVTAGLLDRFDRGPLVYAAMGVTALVFIGGFLLIALGWRADKAAALLTVLAVAPAAAQTPRQRTYANPIDIDYRYNFEQMNQGISYRSGADRVIVVHRGEYYLFETIGDGYWRSSDLGSWEHITPSRWPLNDIVAPAALSVRDTIYLLPSTTSPLPILMLTEPASGRVEFYNRLLPWLPLARDRETEVLARPDSVQPGPWDPQFFHDPDTDRWFLYWNSSNAYPLHAIELDKTKRVRWGISPAKLYQTYQWFADQGSTLELRALTVGQAYWAAIESFDENGVSALSAAVPIR